MKTSGIVICGPGKVRRQNQDNYYLNGKYRSEDNLTIDILEQEATIAPALYAVADGMGGEQYGELASQVVVSKLSELDCNSGSKGLAKYLIARNKDICKLIEEKDADRIGTTFVGLCFCEDRVDVVNIGDSRAYLYRNGDLTQISKDHTLIRQMIELGSVSPEDARKHPDRHKLTQHLGIFPEEMIIEPCTRAEKAMAEDVFLLCSDGLYDAVEDQEIKQIMDDSKSTREMAENLFSAAMDAGGKDNITILLVKVLDATCETVTHTKKSSFLKSLLRRMSHD